jgi:predicted AlkP superfamily phosphohydrolase/phosphomutase
MQVMLIGLDAACPAVLEPLFESGRLPHLQSIVERGVAGPLESQLPPWTPSAWPSLYTGTNPGRHGVFSFLRYEGYDWDVVNATDIHELTLWEILSRQGLASVVVNAPVTHPPPDINGAIIPGYIGPEDPKCHPPGLLAELRDAIGAYRVYSNHEFETDAPERERIDEYHNLVRTRGEAFLYLIERFDPDFGFVQFQQTDTVVHDFPGDREKLRLVYEAVDRQIGSILEACEPDAIVVASDHGIGEYENYEFRVNEFLRQKSLLATTAGGGMPSWVPVWRDELSRKNRGNEVRRSRRGLRLLHAWTSIAARFGFTGRRVITALERLGAKRFVARYVPAGMASHITASEMIDFPSSTAYMRLPVELGVRINVVGREPNGVVVPEDYDAVRDHLIRLLDGVKTPDDEPVFEAVLPREEVFWGPCVDSAVDIVTVPSGFEQFPTARLSGEVFGAPDEPWNHKLYGFVAVAGEGVDATVSLDDAHLLDVAPTVLAALGVPQSDRMDGSALPVVEPAGNHYYPRPERRTDLPTDDDRLEARLSDLGYLE